jgi:hypothetical protein
MLGKAGLRLRLVIRKWFLIQGLPAGHSKTWFTYNNNNTTNNMSSFIFLFKN